MPLATADKAQSDRMRGLAYGIGTGALWGLVFLAPELVRDFKPLDIAVGRYLVYGLLSMMLIAPRWRSIASRLGRSDIWRLAWLAMLGNTVYYIFLAKSVQSGGVALASLLMGFIPVTVTVIGSLEQGAVKFVRLLPSIILCLLGGAFIGWDALSESSLRSTQESLIGLAFGIAALVSWTAYAVGNARYLRREKSETAHDWNLLIGLMTGLQALVLIPMAWMGDVSAHSLEAWSRLLGVSVGLAILCSLLGNLFWNRASQLLPMTMVGQMIVFETVFALIYGLLWEQRLPTVFEMLAMACVIASVLACVAAHPKSPNKKARVSSTQAS